MDAVNYPAPQVVLIDVDNRVHVIRKGDTMEAMSNFENTPEYLREFDL